MSFSIVFSIFFTQSYIFGSDNPQKLVKLIHTSVPNLSSEHTDGQWMVHGQTANKHVFTMFHRVFKHHFFENSCKLEAKPVLFHHKRASDE